MKSFQHKRGWKKIAQSRPVLLLLGILLFAFAWSVFGFTGKMEETRENRKIAERKVSQLEKEKEQLASDIARLETDQGVEASIRDRFGMGKEGEKLIVIVEDKSKSNEMEAPKQSFFAPLFFWRNWFK